MTRNDIKKRLNALTRTLLESDFSPSDRVNTGEGVLSLMQRLEEM